MSNAWSLFIAILVLGNILALIWLLFATNNKPKGQGDGDTPTTGHQWDGIEELDTPMPRWWLWMFVISVVFSLVYLVLYPGLGNYAGTLGWTQEKQYQESLAGVQQRQQEVLANYAEQDVESLADDTSAMATASRIFANNCSTCHGSDARGAIGFPNLTDNDWLYGGEPEQIMHSIAKGRQGAMPPFGQSLDDKEIYQLSHYVVDLSRGSSDDIAVRAGEKLYATSCAMCHGTEGKGNIAMGAPNLTDNTWLYGRTLSQIQSVIREGRNGNMPPQEDILSEESIHLLTAYLLSFDSSGSQQ